jgi:methionyl-tRNA formyltransferase
MTIEIYCGTHRGLLCLRQLTQSFKGSKFRVFSFKEEPWEPAFFGNIKRFCKENQIEFRKWPVPKNEPPSIQEQPADVIIAISWRFLIPSSIYTRAIRGAYVFHDSLLPKYRGFSPTVWAILNGERRTGVSLIEMAEGVDTGAIYRQISIQIKPDQQIKEVMQEVNDTYLKIIKEDLGKVICGKLKPRRQKEANATYCCKRIPADAKIDWSKTALEICDLVRASSSPYPGAYFTFENQNIRCWLAKIDDSGKKHVGLIPGRVIGFGIGGSILVGTGRGSVELKEVERPGKSPESPRNFINKLSATLG